VAVKLFVNGRFHRAGRWDPAATALAVSGDRIVAVVTDDLVDWRRPGTEVVDLGGGWVLPGLQDAHVHPVSGGMEMNRCNLAPARTAPEYLAVVAAYAAANPDVDWILGGGWAMEAFPGGVPTAAALDPVVADRPVFLPNRDHHSAWVNSAALRLAGIDAGTPDPVDGRVERDADGEPTGALHEGAMDLVGRHIPLATEEEVERGLLTAQSYLHALGITAWQDALVGEGLGMPDVLPAYLALTGSGALTARVVGALWWDRERGVEQIEELCDKRATAAAAGFRATSVKIMQDGVCETFTAAMLDGYRDAHGNDTANHGISFIAPDALAAYVTALDAEDFQVHVHALGDRAVRDTLDALAAARAANGATDNRHHLAHLQVIHRDDLPRFAALGATANVQALWACNDAQMTELTLPFLSETARHGQYLFASLLRAGARLACGSDWPVSTPNPFAQMHVAVNRTLPDDERAAPLLPAEALTPAQALAGFTTGAAYVNHLDDTGAIEPGMLADLTVVDGDLLGPDTAAIADIRATMTIVGGRVVHSR
jgi:predicted amidohydrolase YtcJ